MGPRGIGSGGSGPRPRPALHQHDPHALDRRDPEGQLGPPGHADGAGAGRLHALAALPALRPRRPDLARPRPLRALRRPRLDAALLAAPPGRGARRSIPTTRSSATPPSRSTTSRASASSTRARPATPSTAGPRASRRPPARSARASPPRSAWRSPRKWQGARYNRPGFDLFDFDVYAIAGDGCLMEGVSSEAASIAGHLKLDNLCWVYDNNHITIDGKTHLAYDDDVAARFMGYGWNVTRVGDANDTDLIATAFEEFKGEEGRPTLIIVDSHIGYGSPHKVDTSAAHGEPLGEEEVRETKRAYGWPEDAQFLVPDGVREHFAAGIGKRGAELRAAWKQLARRLREGERRPRRRDRGAAEARAARRLGRRRSPASTPTRRGSPPARPRSRSRTRSPRACPGCSPAPPTSPTRPRCGSSSTAPRTSSPAPTTAASSTSASASTSRRRSPTASRSPSCARSGRPTSPSPTTRGRRSASRR